MDWLFGTSQSRKRRSRSSAMQRARAPLAVRLEVFQLEDRLVPSTFLGTASSFAVLGGSTVTNTGPSVINGDLGVNPGSAVVGFPPGIVTPPGAIHIADAVAVQAQTDLVTAYNALASQPVTQDLTGQDLGGLTLTPGVYFFSSTAQLTGTLTLDFEGDPDALFVFQVGSALTTASSSSVVMINGDELTGCEVYWQVGSSATLGASTSFVGNIVALTSITLVTGANIESGRALARNGAVTLDTNVITMPACDTGDISGMKFNDLNGNGVLDPSEAGIAGLTVYIDANQNGAFDPGEMSTTTDADGNYTFADLIAGRTYRIRQVPADGIVQTTPNPADIDLEEDEDVTDVNFGDFYLISISGAKFQDINGDGTRDVGDPGVQGWTVYLDANDNGMLDPGEVSTTTDADGNYTFADLGPGTYLVREVQQGGSVQSTANPDPIVASSGTDVTGATFGNNFGTFQLFSISGAKFRDANGNGVRDPLEVGLAGWTIFIDANGNGTLDAGETRTLTDASGNYTFVNLGPGTYQIREVGQVNWVRMTINPADIVGTSGVNVTQVTFGNIAVSSLLPPSKRLLIGSNLTNLRNGTFSRQATFVANLYESLLGRPPDLAGIRRYLQLLLSGYTQAQVTAMFRVDFRL